MTHERRGYVISGWLGYFLRKDTEMTTTSEHMGTAIYLVPELAATEETVYPTTSSDVHALGCLGLEVSLYVPSPAHTLDEQSLHSLYIFKSRMPTA
jgi:hypothetical protein